MFTQEEQDQDSDQHVEVVDELVLEALKEARLEELAPRPARDQRDEEEEHHDDLRVQEAGNQGPVKTHLDAFFLN